MRLFPGQHWPFRPAIIAAVLLLAGAIAFPAERVSSDHLAGGQLLPDLQTLNPANFSITGNSLYFDNEVMNLHTGVLELVPTSEKCTTGKGSEGRIALQRIFNDSNGDGGFSRGTDTSYTEQVAGCMTFHALHHHWHFDDFALFELLQDGVPVADISLKMTFCVADVNRRANLMSSGSQFSPASDYYTTCNREQGLSVGWGDNYPNGTAGQYINVTNVANGTYCFVTMADHLNKLKETNDSNNVNSRWITLSTGGSGARIVSAGSVGCHSSSNAAPTANSQSVNAQKDTLLTINLAGADVNGCAGQTFTFNVTSGPSSGSLNTATGPMSCAGGSLSAGLNYTPNSSFTGPDSFAFAISDGSATSNTATVSITVSDPAAKTHVSDLDSSSSNQGSTWTAMVTVIVHNGNHEPVANATVSGSFTWNGSSSPVSCLTNGSGQCTVQKGGIRKRFGSVTFSVANVTHATLTYDSSANHDPESDSNGTSISVSKP